MLPSTWPADCGERKAKHCEQQRLSPHGAIALVVSGGFGHMVH